MATRQADLGTHEASMVEVVRGVLADVLALKPAVARGLDANTPLFGALPELDSMAVASVLTELEDRIDIVIDDDEVDGALFATFGSLVAFVAAKRARG